MSGANQSLEEPHVELDIPAIVVRLHRLLVEAHAHPQASRDVDTLMAEAGYWRAQHQALQRSLGALTERLGRLQRGDKPDSDNRRS